MLIQILACYNRNICTPAVVFCVREIIYSCQNFTSLFPIERSSKAKSLNICVNCLHRGHSTRECKAKGRRECTKIYDTLLHLQISSIIHDQQPSASDQCGVQTNNHSALTRISKQPCTLLSTSVIQIPDNFGTLRDCVTLLDSGSEISFISVFITSLVSPVKVTFTSCIISEKSTKKVLWCNITL